MSIKSDNYYESKQISIKNYLIINLNEMHKN